VSFCFAASSAARVLTRPQRHILVNRSELTFDPALYNAAGDTFLSHLRAPALAHQHAYLPVQSAGACHSRHTLCAHSAKQNNIARLDRCVCTYCIVCHLLLIALAETTFERICSENNITIPSKWTRRVELASLPCCPYCK